MASSRVLVALGNRALNGQERGNIEVFRALKGHGVEAVFCTHEAWGHEAVEPLLDQLGLRWRRLPYPLHFTGRLPARVWPANLRRWARCAQAMRLAIREEQATHVHLANPHYALSVLPALMTSRVPVVYRMGDEPTLHHPLYRTLWKVLARRVERFVCISEFVCQSALASGVPSHKLRVVYSHPPLRPSGSQDTVLPSHEGRTVVFVGQVSPHKGADLFVEAATRLSALYPDVRFVLAGRASDPVFAQRLAAEILRVGLAQRILLLGYVNDVPGLLAVTDVHVCPSICGEALGNVVLEAKLAGVPSVVFPSGGLPELVAKGGEDGLVCSGLTAGDLIVGLEHYLSLSPDALVACGRAAHASMGVLGINEEAFAAAWRDVYGDISTKTGPPL